MIDSHCHFDFPDFDADREQVWQQCQAVGLKGLLIPGVCPSQWVKAKQLCESHQQWHFAVGLHPWWLEQSLCGPFDTNHIAPQLIALSNHMRDYAADKQCIAIGECGLDGYKTSDFVDKHAMSVDEIIMLQRQVLRAHLTIANELNKPIICHSVKAHAALLEELKATPPRAGGVIHAFSGSTEIATQYWRLGMHIGVGGGITYERARKTRAAIQSLPLDALLLETDAPSMPLSGKQGERNSPEYLLDITRALAELKNTSIEHVIAVTTHNFRRLFKV